MSLCVICLDDIRDNDWKCDTCTCKMHTAGLAKYNLAKKHNPEKIMNIIQNFLKLFRKNHKRNPEFFKTLSKKS